MQNYKDLHSSRKSSRSSLVSSVSLSSDDADLEGSTIVRRFVGDKQGYLDGEAPLFNRPFGLAFDSVHETLYACDFENRRIRAIKKDNGKTSTIAGSGIYGRQDGKALQAQFGSPWGITCDSSREKIFVSDCANHCIVEINDGYATTLGDIGSLHWPCGLAYDPVTDSIYVAEGGGQISRISNDGKITKVAGSSASGFSDGKSSHALFDNPRGLAIDSMSGTLYVADGGNHRIRQISRDGIVTTLAGDGTIFGCSDGRGTSAQLYYPWGVAVDPHNSIVYATDTENDRVIMISKGYVSTLVGNENRGCADGKSSPFQITKPYGIAYDPVSKRVFFSHGNQIDLVHSPKLDFVTVKLRIHYNTNYGEGIFICGSIPILGNWNPARAHRMNWNGNGWWTTELIINKNHLPLEYKYIVRSTQLSSGVIWEGTTSNRVITEHHGIERSETWGHL